VKRDKPAYPIQTLETTIQIINCLEKLEKEAGISEISHQTGLGISIIHRHLDTLCYHRFVDQDPDNQKYRLGLRFFELGESVLQQINIGKLARPYLEDLMAQVNETVNLGVLHNDQVIFIDKIECRETLRAVSHPGKTYPLYCSGMGKALLAFLPDAKRQSILREIKPVAYTDKTLTDIDLIRKDLENIRKTGYALDDQEVYQGIRCLAMPILNRSGYAVASISVSGPSMRLSDEQIEKILPMLSITAEKISTNLGYDKLMKVELLA
jgi:DNA-binding IclR family transcriptional regulator